MRQRNSDGKRQPISWLVPWRDSSDPRQHLPATLQGSETRPPVDRFACMPRRSWPRVRPASIFIGIYGIPDPPFPLFLFPLSSSAPPALLAQQRQTRPPPHRFILYRKTLADGSSAYVLYTHGVWMPRILYTFLVYPPRVKLSASRWNGFTTAVVVSSSLRRPWNCTSEVNKFFI